MKLPICKDFPHVYVTGGYAWSTDKHILIRHEFEGEFQISPEGFEQLKGKFEVKESKAIVYGKFDKVIPVEHLDRKVERLKELYKEVESTEAGNICFNVDHLKSVIKLCGLVEFRPCKMPHSGIAFVGEKFSGIIASGTILDNFWNRFK